ncbi:MAG: LamG domain-containing protein, partial [Candidatus Marinimicrobia bacterium]|nr:LamG domain-containing protein [Candidatus Neomarinimicrobiota bacterium]
MELDFYAPGGLEGLAIEYRTGDGSWNEVLSYEIAAGVSVNFSLSTQAFIANVTDSIQLGFRAYGLNSYNINSWDIDNVKVKNIPSLIDVTIISNNQTNSAQATVGDLILLTFEGSTALSSTAAIIGVTQVYPTSLQGNAWQASYTVQQDIDPEGPIPFVIMFTDNSNVDGTPVTETMDSSLVIIDNSGPGPFAVDTVVVLGGTVMGPVWNNTNDSIHVSIPLPPDSAVTSFNFTTGNSLGFNDNKSLIIPNSIELRPLSALTVEAWVKPTGYNDWEGFFDQATYESTPPNTTISGYGWVYFGSGWHFVIGGTGMGNSSATVNDFPVVATQTNVWTHIAATYNGSKIYVYRNGSVVDSASTSFNSIHYTNLADPVIIGSYNSNGADHYFNGKIDEVRVWDAARTKVEIQGYMGISLTGNETNLVGYWKIDEESNGYVIDESSSGNNAQINAALWVNDSPIDFKTAVYDYNTIAGSYIQLTAKEGVNPADEMTDIGDLIEITIDDSDLGTTVANASAASFESIPGLVNTSTITIGAKILDAAGNTTIGTPSTSTIYVEHVAELPDSINIISDNPYSNQVANSESNITLYFRSGEPIDSSTVLIAGREATVTAISGNDYQATLILNGTEPSGPLSISVVYTDTMANTLDAYLTTTDGSEVVNDLSAPQINTRQISSNNSNSNYAKVGDTVWVNFTANEPLISGSISSQILGRTATLYGNQGDQTISYYIVPNDSDSQGLIGFQILAFRDYAGNSGTVPVTSTTDGSSITFDRTNPDTMTINNVIATGG